MNWVTAITCSVQDQKPVEVAMIKAEIADLTFRIQVEDRKGEEDSIAHVLRTVLKIHKAHLARIEK